MMMGVVRLLFRVIDKINRVKRDPPNPKGELGNPVQNRLS
jgi:hypothetical protein